VLSEYLGRAAWIVPWMRVPATSGTMPPRGPARPRGRWSARLAILL